MLFRSYYQSAGAVNPPACVDNIVVTSLACSSPSFYTPELTDSSAIIRWRMFNNPLKWEVKVSSSELDSLELIYNTDLIYENNQIDTNSLSLNYLKANKLYYVYLRSICNGNDTSNWSS